MVDVEFVSCGNLCVELFLLFFLSFSLFLLKSATVLFMYAGFFFPHFYHSSFISNPLGKVNLSLSLFLFFSLCQIFSFSVQGHIII